MILSLQEQRKRLDNIVYSESNVIKCVNRTRINDYIAGQVTYNLGGYPSRFSIKPTEYDYELIKSLSEKGVGLIQIHEEWNDSIRVLGADKFSTHDKEGMDEFIDLCHRFGIKIIPYISTGFFDERDKDFSENFSEYSYNLNQLHFKYRMCSLKSPQWCEYLYRKTVAILDRHDFDGLYNDMGHDECCHAGTMALERGENPDDAVIPYEPCAEDMLSRMYSMVKSRGKIMKHHYYKNQRPSVKEKVYDYLWVGEAVPKLEALRQTALYEPYVVPCPDFQYTPVDNPEKFFALFMPLMQFPLRADGRPYDAWGKLNAPNVEYFETSVTAHTRKLAQYQKEHPNGPFGYSEWSSIPDNAEYREKWFYYLKLYKMMTVNDTLCHIDIKESTITKNELSENICMSLFSGVEQYVCISNLGDKTEEIVFNDEWIDCESDELSRVLTLTPYKVRILKRADLSVAL